MRLYQGRIPTIAADIVNALTAAGDVETAVSKEVMADVESVLNQYVDAERRITEEAKDIVASRNLSQREFGRTKKLIADKKGIPIGEDMLDHLLDQIVAMLMYSANVDEVYVEDVELRRRMAPVLKREIAVDEQVEKETRARLGHVQEGTRTWEVEYQRVIQDIRRRKGL